METKVCDEVYNCQGMGSRTHIEHVLSRLPFSTNTWYAIRYSRVSDPEQIDKKRVVIRMHRVIINSEEGPQINFR